MTAKRAGTIMRYLLILPIFSVFEHWSFNDGESFWWSFVFEMAWAKRHPLLLSQKEIWTGEKGNVRLPYDLEQLSFLQSGSFKLKFPEKWLTELPEAWTSQIDDISAALVDALDILTTEFESYPPPKQTEIDDLKKPDSATITFTRRFKVALSFPGENRDVVNEVAGHLGEVYEEQKVLYDQFHHVEFARLNLDTHLQNLYRNESDLVVVFLSKHYSEKEWCGLEWRAIRDLMKDMSRADNELLILKLGDAKLDGLLSIDGYIDVSQLDALAISKLIMKRYSELPPE